MTRSSFRRILSANAAQTKAGDLVYKGDIVSTGADAAVGITFVDGTVFNLASNARMVLNEFVYDPKGNSNSTFFSLSKGAFTFFAGKVARTGNMKIDTPIATMGIRGTIAHVEILSDGTVTFNTLVEDKKAMEKSIGGDPTVKQETASGQNRTASWHIHHSEPAPVVKHDHKPDGTEMKIDSSYFRTCRPACNGQSLPSTPGNSLVH